MENTAVVLDMAFLADRRRYPVSADYVCPIFLVRKLRLTASSRGKLKSQADKGERGAQSALTLTEDSERMIGAILLGNNNGQYLGRVFGNGFVHPGCSAIAAWAFATLVMTVLVLIFSEVLPKTYAISNPERTALKVAPPLRVVVAIFSPVVAVGALYRAPSAGLVRGQY